MPFTLVTFPWTLATPGLLDPPDLGAVAATVPAGSFAEVASLQDTIFDNPGGLYAYITSPDQTSYASLGQWFQDSTLHNGAALLAPTLLLPGSGNPLVNAIPAPAQAITDCQIRLAFYSDATPPTQGAGTLLIKIYS